jgi:thiosulfate dehydrogenase (quinone) large subunit
MATAQPTLDAREALLSEPSAGVSAPATALGIVRILLGSVFLWSFLDKTFGLYATAPGESWLAGNSPTSGYLGSVDGTFGGVFNAMAGQAWVDWSFMLGMGLVGAALVLGVGLRLAAVGAVALMGTLYLSSLPLENNPVVDEHLIYAVLAVALASIRAGDTLGAGRWWSSLAVVRNNRWLA